MKSFLSRSGLMFLKSCAVVLCFSQLMEKATAYDTTAADIGDVLLENEVGFSCETGEPGGGGVLVFIARVADSTEPAWRITFKMNPFDIEASPIRTYKYVRGREPVQMEDDGSRRALVSKFDLSQAYAMRFYDYFEENRQNVTIISKRAKFEPVILFCL